MDYILNFQTLPLWLNLTLFFLAGVIVWVSGTRLTTYADIISDRKNWDKASMGFIFLALATQLPEIVTNTTGALHGNGELVLNAMFGGMTMQTAVLAIADIFVIGSTLSYAAQKSINLLQGVVLILLLSFVLVATMLGDTIVFWHIGLSPILLALLYIFSIFIFLNYGKHNGWSVANIPDEIKQTASPKEKSDKSSHTTQSLYLYSGYASLAILISGVILVQTAEAIATQSGLGSSFIGVTLLASSTSLPELSATIAAVRLGAMSMAVSNIFGSNLIMIFLLLPADMFYFQGAILNSANDSAKFALLSGIVVTAIYVIGLIVRKSKTYLKMGLDSITVLFIYIITLYILYTLKGT
ncbi:sodium:calcium antiporter [Sulfurimonas sp. CS5]|jgi:cation:H+ antiporter|uniref:sodium:calcium antiporter n=1 Tax=Sulfurimonas sp. CS5 TaxID=3391145 RepID=UPI0039E7F9C8